MTPTLTDWARSPIYKNPEEGIGNRYVIWFASTDSCY